MSFQIETERLRLRDVREDDLEILIAQSAEIEGRRGILSYQADEGYNRRVLMNALAQAKFPQRDAYTLSVELKNNQTLIGSCNIVNARRDSIETNIGWHYGSKFWGNGYGTEAARALLYIGFARRGAAEIFADCFADNRASIRVMEKIGMKSSRNLGLFNAIRGSSYGEKRPAVRYIISKEKWLAQTNRKPRENG
jgi:RimJ/RimL family protein N-acetyltransferase